MSEVCVFLADGFEEIEGLTVVDVLRRAGIGVETVSVMEKKKINGSHKIIVKADTKFEKADFSETKMLVLPGGLIGTRNLGAHKGLEKLLEQFAKEGKYLAAICAAPTILGGMGFLQGKKATCYPSMEDGLVGAEPVAEGAVIDGNVITGRGMGASLDFAFALVEVLRGREKADEIANQIVYEGRK
ncbi:MAG: DJ-1 family glyoxalase III [Bariatricus sp.]